MASSRQDTRCPSCKAKKWAVQATSKWKLRKAEKSWCRASAAPPSKYSKAPSAYNLARLDRLRCLTTRETPACGPTFRAYNVAYETADWEIGGPRCSAASTRPHLHTPR